MQFGPAKQSIGIVFDSDIGNDPGALLALALLNGLEGKNDCRIISLSTTKSNVKSAALLDVVARFYSSAITGFGAEFSRNRPIGMSELGFSKDDTPMLTVPLARADYTTSIKKFNDTAEPHALIRNMLTAQQDGNAAVVLCGPATNLVRAMDLQNTASVVRKKVHCLYLSTSSFASDLPAARKLLADWPSPIVAVGPEIGAALPYPDESFAKDFSWTTAHPILDAVKASKQTAISTSCLAAVLYAAREKENYFKVSDPGTFTLSDAGKLTFTPGADGKHRQLLLDPEQHDHILKSYTELVSAKPVPRNIRPRVKDDAKKPDTTKPSDNPKTENPKPESAKPAIAPPPE